MMAETSPFTLVAGAGDDWVSRLLLRSGMTSVAVLDALDLTGEYEIFKAFNEAFRFPVYFGWNWNALYDCLADLSWMPAERYIVVIKNAELLDISADAHRLLFKALQRAARSVSSPTATRLRVPAEFKVLLSCESDDEPLERRLRAAEVGFDRG